VEDMAEVVEATAIHQEVEDSLGGNLAIYDSLWI
jgi:hypothetical protein